MYINGTSLAITETTGTADGVWFGDLVTDADAMWIGVLARSNDYAGDMAGGLALPVVCSAALSADAIAGFYNQTRHLFGV